MKIIALLLILASCNQKKNGGYVTGSWYCENLYNGSMGTIVKDCTNIMTGEKKDVIYNPTFVIPVEENEKK
jgi:hypothetical protein